MSFDPPGLDRFAADVHSFVDAVYGAELQRLEADCSEAIWLTPDRLDRLMIVKLDSLRASLPDRVGWLACSIEPHRTEQP